MRNCLLAQALCLLLLDLMHESATAISPNEDSNLDTGRKGIASNGSGMQNNLLLRTMEDDADHCVTSADCAFNGECIKKHTMAGSANTITSRKLYEGDSSNFYYDSESFLSKIDPEAPGRCECFAGWKGRTCEVLDLLPVDPHRVGLVLPNHDSSTWGGSVVYHEGDGLYHMFASEILYNCGLYSWTTNSQVIRATSKSPFGPYRKVQVILPPFAHDTNVVRAPTGEFVLYITGRKGVKPKDCRNQTNGESIRRHRYLRDVLEESDDGSSKKDDVPPKDTYMLWSPTPEGPWSEPVMVLNSTKYNSDYWERHNITAKCDSNLNGIILPAKDGEDKQSFLGLWRRCETKDLLTIPHALVASDWRNASTYQPIIDHPLFVLAGSGSEDPSNIWTTRTSDMREGQVAYHAIFHDEQATRCMLGSCGGQGRHAVSLDGKTWKYASVNAYDRYFSWESSLSVSEQPAIGKESPSFSKKTVRADTRARPHIILAPKRDGDNPLQQIPIALSTGLKETDESGYVYTLVQPLGGQEDGLR